MAILLFFAGSAQGAADPVKGKTMFEANCASCHTLDGPKSTGPNLRGVHTRPGRTEAWLLKWIKNSPGVIKSGDPIATKLYAENNQANMTPFGWMSDDEIKNILEYIKTAPVVKADAKKADTAGADAPVAAETAPNKGLVKWINFFILAIVLAVLAIIGYVFDLVSLISKYTRIPIANANRINAWMMILFLVAGMAFTIWETFAHGKLIILGNSASAHGEAIDTMLIVTAIVTGFVFIVTQILLFYFAFRYQHRDGKRAYFYPHNNTLEYVWTIIPAIALAVLVITGFTYWVDITRKAPKEAEPIEVFAYQFGWTARYPGKDGKFGPHSFNLISGTNPLGLGVSSQYEKLVEEVVADMKKNEEMIAKMELISDPTKEEKKQLAMYVEQVRLQKAHLRRLEAMKNDKNAFSKDAEDDNVVQEIALVKDRPFEFKFRARDVIHSAYMPHFRMQMNCVPGIPTSFWFIPTKSTKEMRVIENNNKFDYYMYCAKICGSSHYNMRIKVTVFDTEVEYQEWLSKQKAAFAPEAPAEAAAAPADSAAAATTAPDSTITAKN